MRGEVIEGDRRTHFNLEVRLRGISTLNIDKCGPGRSFDISIVVCGAFHDLRSLNVGVGRQWNTLYI